MPLLPGEIGYREIVESVPHMSEDDLERYAMKTLNVADLDRLDDHLLVCPECRKRLGETERYVLAMRAAAARLRESGTGE